MDNLTRMQRGYNMSRIRSIGTKLEKKFFKLLDEHNITYAKHPRLEGKPDCQLNDNILIFLDSDFWHGWRFNLWKGRLPKEYWVDKILGNIERDKKKFRRLRKQGYTVIRIWGHNLRHPDKVIDKIKSYL